MKNTSIQWTDDSVNPVMGCDGCPLWLSPSQIAKSLSRLLTADDSQSYSKVLQEADEAFSGRSSSDIYSQRHALVKELSRRISGIGQNVEPQVVLSHIEQSLCCYAGKLGSMRAGHRGYAPSFDKPAIFAGRVARAASSRSLLGVARKNKPWIPKLPRMVFISDMGDALSAKIPFATLHDEIILPVSTPAGRRHIWQWLTKRPNRMVDFANYLKERNTMWPDNLVAMTSVWDQQSASRAAVLSKVPARVRGLSVEPLRQRVELDLRGIGWVIVGGESGKYASRFELDWARDIIQQCRNCGVAVFVKQLGSKPCDGEPVKLTDSHGGDWEEWPSELRHREFPAAFSTLNQTANVTIPTAGGAPAQPGFPDSQLALPAFSADV